MATLIKYFNTIEGFQEIPDEISLLINITNCQCNCLGCHSPFLRDDVGVLLTKEVLEKELKKGPFTCVCLMGEGNDKAALTKIIQYIEKLGFKSAVYSGRDIDASEWCQEYDIVPTYLKVGSYNENLGPLNKETTNQRLYHCENSFKDITYKFWRKKND